MDIVGKLPVAPGGFKFLLTATDYFSKWIEAEPLVTIEEANIIRFVWRNIISRFGVPFAIITDNGRQFIGQKYRALLDEYGIKWDTSTLAYPQGNGQAEAANKAISYGLKRRLESRRGKWAKELAKVIPSDKTPTKPPRPLRSFGFLVTRFKDTRLPTKPLIPTRQKSLTARTRCVPNLWQKPYPFATLAYVPKQ
ncbi:uncharacterized protein LOC131298571 [Rhododendron vialii]|uniref:uncharacterized protein LOC131298571 n=1 Tax=Rhododendron vialii TaxID=182163 RepID=UPI0026602E9C|nr:uncharacterized protein LOC131298571 [Rhododendron vialii]